MHNINVREKAVINLKEVNETFQSIYAKSTLPKEDMTHQLLTYISTYLSHGLKACIYIVREITYIGKVIRDIASKANMLILKERMYDMHLALSRVGMHLMSMSAYLDKISMHLAMFANYRVEGVSGALRSKDLALESARLVSLAATLVSSRASTRLLALAASNQMLITPTIRYK